MRLFWIIALWLLPFSAAAQDDGKDFLTAFLETNLSSAGRTVTISGFQGALSSQATMAEMTIADDLGVWLTVRGVTLDWSQSALLSGKIVISEFSADEILLDRLPKGDSGVSPEAGSFALPALPVSIDIKALAARRIALGPEVLGQGVEGQLSAALQLGGGEAAGHLDLIRTDGVREGRLEARIAFVQATGALDLVLKAEEAAGGVAVGLLGVPGAPEAALRLEGRGLVGDFVADVSLNTDGVTRLGGKVRVTTTAEGTGFEAKLSGDPTPVFLPEYAAFFGPDVALVARGQRFADGSMALSDLAVTTDALALQGRLSLDADLVPMAFALNGRIGLPDGPVVLPLATEGETRLDAGTLSLSYDRSTGEDWTLKAALKGLDHPEFTAEAATLEGKGRITRDAATALFTGDFGVQASGLGFARGAVAEALGTALTGQARLDWETGAALKIRDLSLAGQGFQVETKGTIGDVAEGIALTGSVAGRFDDLGRLAGLTGLDLGGAAEFELAGNGNLLTGFADLSGELRGRSLKTGTALADGLLTGDSALRLSLRRDGNGTELRELAVVANGLTADLRGWVRSSGVDLAGEARLADLAVLGAGFRGEMAGNVSLTGPLETVSIDLSASGSGLAVGQSEADVLLAGESRLSATLNTTAGGTILRQLDLANPQMRLTATGRADGTGTVLDLEHQILNLGVIFPLFPGEVTTKGTARLDDTGYLLELTSTGPADIDARVTGLVASDFGRADLVLAGTASAGLANKLAEPRSLSGRLGFDLVMRGPIGLASLNGPVRLTEGRLADPDQTFGVTDLTGSAQLAGGRAEVRGNGSVTSGGSLSFGGSVGLTSPYGADVSVALNRVVLRDPDLYSTRLGGALTFRGPILGVAEIAGTVNLERTELRIPSTGFDAEGALPGLRHVAEPSGSRATRERAGLGGPGAAASASGGYALNVRVRAPEQVFIRGRGLDAELGGEVVLRGRTDAVSPSGSFTLKRGRLDILGRRLTLSEALLQMQGALVPFVRIVAAVDSGGITAQVVIEGAATDPVVRFTASPDLPQEEVLARLLFDRGLDTLSAFQAIQLAGAVATLAGRGGEGVIGNLRRRAGLDNLDVTQDAAGGTALTVGKYLSDKTYSEVTVSPGGKTSVSINLDLAPHVTLKGRLEEDGQTGIGVFLQRDY